MQRDGKDYYYHHDRLGSVIGITNQDEELIEQYEYTAFGKVTIKDADGNVLPKSQIGNSYYFTGRRLDRESGLYYSGNGVYYSPEVAVDVNTPAVYYSPEDYGENGERNEIQGVVTYEDFLRFIKKQKIERSDSG